MNKGLLEKQVFYDLRGCQVLSKLMSFCRVLLEDGDSSKEKNRME